MAATFVIAAIDVPWAVAVVAVILVLATSLTVLGRGN